MGLLWGLVGCGSDEPASAALAALTATVTPAPVGVVVTPLPPTQGNPPTRLAIPAIALAVPVAPMAWQVTTVNGERQAVWQIPEAVAGWHLNSARPGAAGNVIISGQHLAGAAVFAPLARGQVKVGQTLHLTDEAGQVFLYTITEVAEPLPMQGNAEAAAQAAIYLEPTIDLNSPARVVLVTGWPEFSDTHYLFVVAELTGMMSVE